MQRLKRPPGSLLIMALDRLRKKVLGRRSSLTCTFYGTSTASARARGASASQMAPVVAALGFSTCTPCFYPLANRCWVCGGGRWYWLGVGSFLLSNGVRFNGLAPSPLPLANPIPAPFRCICTGNLWCGAGDVESSDSISVDTVPRLCGWPQGYFVGLLMCRVTTGEE